MISKVFLRAWEQELLPMRIGKKVLGKEALNLDLMLFLEVISKCFRDGTVEMMANKKTHLLKRCINQEKLVS